MIQKRLVILEAKMTSKLILMKYSRLTIFLFFFSSCFLFWRCANPIAPEGGPKDTKPPKPLNFDPPNFSANFKDNSIKIDFDEFIALKNQATEVTVSPPLKNVPDLRLRGKSLVVKLEDTLSANTTYSIDFGKSISDITENNALSGFRYVFSTGPYIDSLSLRGTIVNAFDLIPPKEAFALLYIDRYDTIAFDSLPLKVKPYYVTKANEKGAFIFHNLRATPMKLTALVDQNGNLIFDQASERVAFSDSLVHPYYIPKPKFDSSANLKDSLKIIADTTKKGETKVRPSGYSAKKATADSLKKDSLAKIPAIPNNLLFLFDDIDSTQRIQKSMVIKKGLVMINFRFPVKALHLKPLNCDTTRPWAIQEYSTFKDSLYLWLTDPKMDSLILRVCQDTSVLDTLKLELLSKENKSAGKKDQEKIFLGVNTNANAATFNQFAGNFILSFSYPLSLGKLSLIRLMQDKDTLKPKVYFTDSLKRSIAIATKWKEDKNYSVFVRDSAFIGLNGLANDTLRFGFKTRQLRDFGNLILEIDISKRPGNYVIQLLNEHDALLGEKQIKGNGKVKFEYLNPGKFKVKAIFDRNYNGRWDTGNFRKKIQPEEVFFLDKIIEVRANWDVEEKWAPSSSF
ncbi:MAG: Ig-like domain-containing protein [Bacteroidetes bacterium]|nr:Ig-like domain-containing protein [Bacteroidota bacterium]